MADRVERLTNLLALLLETSEPLSLVQIASELAAQYPDGAQARRAAFERDKAALRDIGVPIETSIVEGGQLAGQTRYRIDRDAYELAELQLEPDEMRALQVAVAAVHTGSGLLQDAIWKLGGDVLDRPAVVSAHLPELPELPAVRAAVGTRSVLEFGYRGTRRELEPWGILLRRGQWYVIGHDRLRGAMRTFRVDRMSGPVRVGEPDAFTRPEHFDPRDAFPADPKLIAGAGDETDVVDAVVRVSPVRAAAIERELGSDHVVARGDDGSIDVVVPAVNLDAFRAWVLGLVEHAVVLEPPAVREHVEQWLRDVAGSS